MIFPVIQSCCGFSYELISWRKNLGCFLVCENGINGSSTKQEPCFLDEICLLIWQHGFARNMSWSIADSDNVEGDPIITLELRDDPYSRSMWDFSFQTLYKVSLLIICASVLLFTLYSDYWFYHRTLWTRLCLELLHRIII